MNCIKHFRHVTGIRREWIGVNIFEFLPQHILYVTSYLFEFREFEEKYFSRCYRIKEMHSQKNTLKLTHIAIVINREDRN